MSEYKSLVNKIPISPEGKTKQKEYLKKGALAVVDQGQELVGGYTDDTRKTINCDLPVIVFGDHTRAVKYISFPFGAGADGIKVLQPKETVLPKYLYYGTQYLVTKMANRGYARHYQFLEKMNLPTPPLSEQQRIVARIEELFSQLDSGVETLRKTKQQLAVYRQAVLKEAFGSVGTNKGVLNDYIIEKPRNGYSPKPVKYKTDYMNLTLTATTGGIFKDGYFKYIDAAIETDSYLWVKHDDILIQRANTIDYVGTAALYSGEDNIYVYPDLMMKCHAIDSVLPQYLIHQLHYQQLRGYYRNNATGTAGSMPKINQTVVCNTPIVMTSFEKQEKVVANIESRLSICDSIEQIVDEALQQAEVLRQSILKQAFEGEL